jgi:hypothetical protein
MPNKLITPKKAAKDILDIIVSNVKEVIPDEPGQKTRLNKEQNALAINIALGATNGLFLGN